MKQRLIVAGAIILIFVVIVGYWLGTAEFTDNLEEISDEYSSLPEAIEKQKEKADEDNGE